MQTFKVEFAFNKHDFLHQNKIIWKHKWARAEAAMVLTTTLIIFLFSVQIYEQHHNPGQYRSIPEISFLTVLTAIVFFRWIMARHKFKLNTNHLAEKYFEMQLQCIYEFSDESIIYRDNEKLMNLKWSAFTGYMIYYDYLILKINDDWIFMLGNKEIETENLRTIYELVKVKLPVKA